MKLKLTVVVGALVFLTFLKFPQAQVMAPVSFQKYEYATIRWAGRDNTHLIRSNAKIEKFRPVFEKVIRPDGADERSFYMNVAMNAMAREGFEVAAMTQDEIVMKRTLDH